MDRGGAPVDRVRGEHPPDDESWRADGLSRSRHSRILDHLLEPLDDPDPGRAATLCAEVSRQALGDYAPALVLLAEPERLRCQVLTAYSLTLFDFARQRGIEGDRLSDLNRWEYHRDMALEGEPPGQPIFVALDREHRRRPFPEEALGRLGSLARRWVGRPRPADPDRADRRSRQLGHLLGWAMLAEQPPPGSAELIGAALRLRALQGGGVEGRYPRYVPLTERADTLDRPDAAQLKQAARREVHRIRALLEAGAAAPAALPPPCRAAARYTYLASRRLLDDLPEPPSATGDSPRLGLARRLGLLARARWLGA